MSSTTKPIVPDIIVNKYGFPVANSKLSPQKKANVKKFISKVTESFIQKLAKPL